MNELTDREEVWNTYMNYRETSYSTLAGKNVKENIVSEANWIIRSQAQSAADLGITVKVCNNAMQRVRKKLRFLR